LAQVCTLDHNAIIGAHPHFSNLYLCNGSSGHGLQHSPAIGRHLAQLIDEAPTTLDLRRLGFDRVLRNDPLFEEGIV
jgi:glycine/D-amino acid oxidase-like deaminating enzyme